MIPPVIHFFWGRDEPFDPISQWCVHSWVKNLSGFHLKQWDVEDLDTSEPFIKEALRLKKFAFLSDILRLQALESDGGIYLDTDVEIRKNLAPLLQNKLFVGFQNKNDVHDWVEPAILGAEAGHPLLRATLNRTFDYFKRTGKFPIAPTMMTEELKTFGLKTYGYQSLIKGKITLYPVETFCPMHYAHRYQDIQIPEETYALHHYRVSWMPRRKKKLLGWLLKIKAPLPISIRSYLEAGPGMANLDALERFKNEEPRPKTPKDLFLGFGG